MKRQTILTGLIAVALTMACSAAGVPASSPAATATAEPTPAPSETVEAPVPTATAADGSGPLTVLMGEIATGPRTVSLLGTPDPHSGTHPDEVWRETLEYRIVLRNEGDGPLEDLDVHLLPSDAIRELYGGKDPFAGSGGWRHNYGRLPSGLEQGETLEVIRSIITHPRDEEDADSRENSLTVEETERLRDVALEAALKVTWDGGSQEFLLHETEKVAGAAAISRGQAIESARLQLMTSWPELTAGRPQARLTTLEDLKAHEHLAGELPENGNPGMLVWAVQMGGDAFATDEGYRYAITVVDAQIGKRLHDGRYPEPVLPLDSTPGASLPTPEGSSPLKDMVTAGGVTYEAETRIRKSSPTADIGPVMLRPWVTFTNTSDQLVQVPLEGCPLRWRLYDDPSRAGAPVWERTAVGCMQNLYVVALQPDEWYEVAAAMDASRVLNDGVSPGRYYVAITLAVRGQPVELAAGEVDLNYGLEGLELQAETSVVNEDPESVHVAVTVTNASDRRVRIEFGACALSLRIYDNPDRLGEAVAHGGQAGFCPAYLAARDLAPGESLSPDEFQLSVPIADILGDRLPDGRYYFMVVVEINGASVDVPAGEVELSSDEVAPLPDDVEITCDPQRPSQEEIEQRLAEIQEPVARAAMYRALHRGTGEVVPGFGGMFVNREDNSIFYVYLLEPDQEQAERAVQIALERLQSDREVSEVRPIQGQYSYSQLREWIDCWDARVPRLSQTTSSGISEGSNRISIGVGSEADIARAERELEALGIPLEAAEINVIGGIRFN